MKRTGFQRKPGKGLARGDGLKRTDGLKPNPEKVREFLQRSRQNARESKPKPPKPRVEFRAPGPASRHLCVRCGSRTGKQAVHWHHVLEQEHLRVYARSTRLRDAEHDKLLKRLLDDRRNLMPLCWDCHGIGGTDSCPLTYADIPAVALGFAAELGPEWIARVEQTYPMK